jgi:NAD(P)H dehydrogenase (quinone)
MTAVAIVYHPAGGGTRLLAEAVARGAASEDGTTASLHAVPDVDHAALTAADAIVFGCPTSMGSASAAFKSFMDGTSELGAQAAWRDKLAAAFTLATAPGGDQLGTLAQLALFAAQHGMIWIGAGRHLGASAQLPPDARGVPEGDLAAAAGLGRRVAAAARRWRGAGPAAVDAPPRAPAAAAARHPATSTWQLPPAARPPLPAPLERTNLRELVARSERLEHHLLVCATIGRARLEVVTSSEPRAFGRVHVSDEYALALPCGDPVVDRYPLRTFLADPATGADAGRYSHRIGDLVLLPVGYLSWPGRLRPPYDALDISPGVRRCGLSLVLSATERTAGSTPALVAPPDRADDVRTYVEPAPPMLLAPTDGRTGTIARIGPTELTLVERRGRLAPTHGGWVVVLAADPATGHAPCDLIRIPAGAALDARGISRALVLSDPAAAPDPAPPAWHALPPPPFAPFEYAPPGALPFRRGALTVEAAPAGAALVSLEGATAAVPRYWLARMLFRAALHGLRLGYVETYGGMFVDDRPPRSDGAIEIGLRTPSGRAAIGIPRSEAIAVIEQLYRAVAPRGYCELLG